MDKDFNTAIVASELVDTPFGHDVRVMILDGEDVGHTFRIDRPAAAVGLILAATEYLNAKTKDDFMTMLGAQR
jgi:hypothetical protein